MLVVVAQHRVVAVAQPQRGVAFPFLGEAAGLGELVACAGWREQLHAAARADRGELAVVSDQQQLRPGLLDVAVDQSERRGVGHGGLVDDHQIAGVQPPCLVALDGLRSAAAGARGEPFLGGEPPGHVARGQPFPDQDVGGDLGGRQAEHPPRQVTAVQRAIAPGMGDRPDHERLAGPGRADQRFDLGAGGEDPADRSGLVDAEFDPGLAQLLEIPPAISGRRAAAPPGAVAADRMRSVRMWSGVQYSWAPWA